MTQLSYHKKCRLLTIFTHPHTWVWSIFCTDILAHLRFKCIISCWSHSRRMHLKTRIYGIYINVHVHVNGKGRQLQKLKLSKQNIFSTKYSRSMVIINPTWITLTWCTRLFYPCQQWGCASPQQSAVPREASTTPHCWNGPCRWQGWSSLQCQWTRTTAPCLSPHQPAYDNSIGSETNETKHVYKWKQIYTRTDWYMNWIMSYCSQNYLW